MSATVIILTTEEAEELRRYLEHQYLNPNLHPHLYRLMHRLDLAVKA